MFWSGWEVLLYVRERSGHHPDVREWSGGHTGCPGVVGTPSQMSGSVREALPDVRE